MAAAHTSSDGPSDRLSGFLRQFVAALRDDARSDSALLAAFVAGDQDAFRVLVGRHGRAVWSVCIAVLGDPHDAEDAFQAAFMALARRAGAIDARAGVGPWVRTAARRAARQLRRSADRFARLRLRLHDDSPVEAGGTAPDQSETWALAAAELDRLPARLREAVVLYHLEGRTLVRAAEVLGCSVAEAHRRVERGVALLRERLSARGVALTASVLAALSAGLNNEVLARAAEIAHGAHVPPRLAALVEAALVPRVPAWVVGFGAAVVLACGAAVGVAAWPDESVPPVAGHQTEKPDAKSAERPLQQLDRSKAALTGRVTDAAGRPVPGASVSALVRRPWLPGDRGLRDDVVAQVTTGADGRYALAVPADFPTHYPERSVTLLVSGPGLPPTAKPVRLGAGTADVGVPAARAVRGVLVAPDGRPGAGVRVGVVRLGGAAAEPVQGVPHTTPDGWPADVTADAHGAFAFAGLPADADVWLDVRDDRFALTVARVAASDSAPVRIELAAPRVLRGRVTTTDTARPLAGTRVSVFAGPWESHHNRYTAVTAAQDTVTDTPPVEFDAVTAADGGFRLRLPSGGPYRVFMHPPDGTAYLPVSRDVTWDAGETSRDLSVALPTGQVLHGVLLDDSGRPVAGGWVTHNPKAENRHAPDGLLAGRDAPVRSAADGSFRLAVPFGPGQLRAFGPTDHFRPAGHGFRRCPSCGTDHLRSFDHAGKDIDLLPGRCPERVTLTLKVGAAVPGRAVGPDGGPVPSGVFVCRSVVQPLRNLVTRPQLIRNGVFELPGCAPGRVYPVVLLDPDRLVGAVTELRAGGEPPLVKLAPCGTAEVRLISAGGRPVPGVTATAAIRLGCDYPVGAAPPAQPGANPVDQSWFDPKHHLPGPVTDAAGGVTLRALVPGAEYVVRFETGDLLYASATFRVKPGQVVRLPDAVAAEKPRSLTEVLSGDGD
ncbi:sigma-70 family RNA polymerase sigma factor [Frigoriglobus tundricola]|uniref:RNA polymerase sigma-70 region 2 domain-containing protein n=1 Tax=Frigoriglobus tundricola TaxID=2774151 RepID=A0A6M5YU96_9BACT|nr:sigma-70 family RNA polymerase sigma factor [Frigoriglobus tundricola]QJW96883.1 hypothetical protein FTUN_4443 [Frigoriglobus tundricola]